MDTQTGRLDDADKLKLVEWLNTKTKSPSCPVCGQNQWHVADHLLYGMPFTPNGLMLGGASYPMAVLTCTNCAYNRTFMAVPVGILPPIHEGEPEK